MTEAKKLDRSYEIIIFEQNQTITQLSQNQMAYHKVEREEMEERYTGWVTGVENSLVIKRFQWPPNLETSFWDTGYHTKQHFRVILILAAKGKKK